MEDDSDDGFVLQRIAALPRVKEKSDFKGRPSTRKFGYCAEDFHQNFIFLFGCGATRTVNADTKMVEEIVDTLTNRFSKESLTLEIPHAFDNIKASDASVEISVSNTI